MGNAEPRQEETLSDWYVRSGLDRLTKKRARPRRATCLLVLWEVWKHRNEVVFNGRTPCLGDLLRKIASEYVLWKDAGLLRGDDDMHQGIEAALRWAQGE